MPNAVLKVEKPRSEPKQKKKTLFESRSLLPVSKLNVDEEIEDAPKVGSK